MIKDVLALIDQKSSAAMDNGFISTLVSHPLSSPAMTKPRHRLNEMNKTVRVVSHSLPSRTLTVFDQQDSSY